MTLVASLVALVGIAFVEESQSIESGQRVSQGHGEDDGQGSWYRKKKIGQEMRNKKVFTKEREVTDVFNLSKILTCYFQVYPYSNSPIAAPPPRLCITAVTLSL